MGKIIKNHIKKITYKDLIKLSIEVHEDIQKLNDVFSNLTFNGLSQTKEKRKTS